MAACEPARRSSILRFMTACGPGWRLPSKTTGRTWLCVRDHRDLTWAHPGSHPPRFLAVPRRMPSRNSHPNWSWRWMPLLTTTDCLRGSMASATGCNYAKHSWLTFFFLFLYVIFVTALTIVYQRAPSTPSIDGHDTALRSFFFHTALGLHLLSLLLR